MNINEKIEKRIIWLSFLAGLFFVLCEFVMAVYSGSQSVLMDAAYDACELLLIGLMLVLTPLFYRPISEKYPFGYAQLESIFIIVKGFMLLAVTIGLSANSLKIALTGGNHVDAGSISLFQLFMGIAGFFVLLAMMRMNKNLSSPTIKAEIISWKLDVYYSIGMSIAFFLAIFLNNTPLKFLTPYFDQIIAVVIVVCMLPESLKMLIRAIKDLFLFSPEEELVEELKEICIPITQNYKYTPLFFDVTRTGRKIWVDLYFKPEENLLDMTLLKKASDEINRALIDKYPDCSCELIAMS